LTVPAVTFSGGGGTGAAGTAVLNNGVVSGVNITNAGSGYTSAPTVSIAPSSSAFTIVVSAKDSTGKVDTNFTGNISLALANIPTGVTGAALGGNTSALAVNGVATFTALTMNVAATGYTIQATSNGLTPITTTSYAVKATTASALAVSTPPPVSVVAGLPFGFKATAVDPFGNFSSSFTGLLSVALANNPGGAATLTGSLTATANAGIATFAGLSINKVGTGYTLNVASSSLKPATSSAIIVLPSAATQLVVTTEPPATVSAGGGFGLSVAAQDPFGNVAELSEPATATAVISPVTIGTVTSGAVTSLTLTDGGAGYTIAPLVALTGGGGTGARATAVLTRGEVTGFNIISSGSGYTSAPTVTIDPPFSMATAMATLGSGGALSGISIVDGGDGYLSVPVVTISPPANGGTTATATAVLQSGMVTAITLTNAGTGYTSADHLVVTINPPVTAATAAATFDPTKGTVTKINVTTGGAGYIIVPSITISGGGGSGATATAAMVNGVITAITVTNPGKGYTSAPTVTIAPAFAQSLTVGLVNNPGNATLAGNTTLSGFAGTVNFTGLSLDHAATGYTLAITNPVLPAAVTTSVTVTPLPATQLVVSTQPPTSVTAGASFGLSVFAEDPFGNVDPTYHGSVTVALGNNPGQSMLSGTVTVTAVNGVATFSGLSLDDAGNGYTLQVSAGGLVSGTTNSFNVVAAPASQLVVTTEPPSSVTAGSVFGLLVTALDPFGNVDQNFSGATVQITAGTGPTGATLGGTTTATANAGVVNFSGLTLDNAGSGYTLTVFSTVVLKVTTTTITVTPAPATQLVLSALPPVTVTAGNPFAFSLLAEDPFGNLATNFTGSVSLALGANPGGAVLGGTLTATPSAGIVTFSGLTLDKVGTGYTLQVSASGFPTVTTSSLSVTPALASQLAITTQPPMSVAAGNPFGLAVIALDPFGNLVPTYNGTITVSVATGPSGAVLNGKASMTASGGASFSGLSLNMAGGYTFNVSATNPDLTGVTTNAVTVTPATAIQLALVTPPPGTVTAGSPFGFAIAAEDSFGNPDPTFAGTLTVALLANPSGATLGGPLTATPHNGVATFSGLTLDTAGSGTTLQITSTLLPSVTTASITVVPGAASQLVVTSGPPGTITAGNPFGVSLAAEDQFGNIDPNYQGSVEVALVTNPGGSTLSGTTTTTASAGTASFSGLSLNKAGNGYVLQVLGVGLPALTTSSINVVPGAPAQLVVSTQPPATVAAGSPFGLTVLAEDSLFNVATGFSGQVTVSLLNNPGGSTLGGSTTATAQSGTITFSGLTLNKVGTGYSLQASANGLPVATTNSLTVAPGTATKIVLTTPPPSTIIAGSPFGLTASAEDALGNVDPTYTGTVAVSLSANPGGSLLGGTTAIAASNGVASFSGLTLNRATSGYAIQVSSGFLPVVTASGLQVTPAAAAQLVVSVPPPATVMAGSPFGLTVIAKDTFGNITPSFSGSMAVSLLSNPGGSTLGGITTGTANHGGITFGGLTLNKAGAGYTIQAISSGLSAAVSTPITVTSATIAQLVVTTQPPATINAGSPFGFGVTAEDTFGNAIQSFNGSVVVSLQSNPGGGTLSSTVVSSLVAPAVNGVAVFPGLEIDRPGNGYTLQASTSGLTTASNAFNVKATPATQLVVTSQPPSSLVAGSAFGLTVAAEDAAGNTDVTFHGPITVALQSNPGSASLGGVQTVNAVNGVAVFSGLTLSSVANGYTLQVSTNGLPTATTAAFNVTGTSTGVSTAKLQVMAQPPGTVTLGGGFGLTVAAVNAAGTVDPSFNGSITLALGNNPGGGTLGGTTTVAARNGIATFTGLSLNKAGTGYTLAASSGTLSASTSGFTVAAPLQLMSVTALTAGTGLRKHITGYQLVFSGALNPNSAQNAGNYIITESVLKGRKTVNLALNLNAQYNPATHAVTLSLSGRHTFSRGGALVVNASSSTGVADSSGTLVDGNNDGTPGGNASFVIRSKGTSAIRTS
jgi:hypothetical protein